MYRLVELVSETGRPDIFKSSHPVGQSHFLRFLTLRPVGLSCFYKKWERVCSLSDSSIFQTKEQAVNRVAQPMLL